MTIGTLQPVPSTLGSLVYTPYRQYQALGDTCPCGSDPATELCIPCPTTGTGTDTGTVAGCIDPITGIQISGVLGGFTDGLLAWPLWIGQSGASPLTDLFTLQTWMCDPAWAIGVIIPPLAVAALAVGWFGTKRGRR